MKVELILSTVLAICTIVYTWINWKVWKENKKTREQKITPFVIAFLKSTEDHNVLTLHIKNIGEGLAQKVKIKIVKDYNIMGVNNLFISHGGIFQNGFSVFPPQYELVFHLDWWKEMKDKVDNEDSYIEIEISYERMDGEIYLNSYKLPFNQLTGQHYLDPPETYIGQISYYLKKINDNIKKGIQK